MDKLGRQRQLRPEAFMREYRKRSADVGAFLRKTKQIKLPRETEHNKCDTNKQNNIRLQT